MALAPCLPRNRPNRQRRIADAVATVPTDTAVARILSVYDSAEPEDHDQGAAWYLDAKGIAADVARLAARSTGTEVTVAQGAGVIAALSPQCSWDENIARARALASGEPLACIGSSKAERILAGEDPWSVLGGRKVRSFYRNILGLHAAVTVDRHAVAIVYGRRLSDTEVKVLERPGTYAVIAGAYRAAARARGISPSTLQAVTWCSWRRDHGL